MSHMEARRAFEWDEAKAGANLAKHGISFEDAVYAFADPDGQIEPDTRGDHREKRFRLFARVDGVPLRVVSARKANRKER